MTTIGVIGVLVTFLTLIWFWIYIFANILTPPNIYTIGWIITAMVTCIFIPGIVGSILDNYFF